MASAPARERVGDLVGEHARDPDSRDRCVDGRLGRVDDEPRMDRDRRLGLARPQSVQASGDVSPSNVMQSCVLSSPGLFGVPRAAK